MQDVQRNIIKEWVTDVDPKYLSNSQAFYIKNRELINEIINKNSNVTANELFCEIVYPIGDNYRVGSYYEQLTNECYVWVFNTNDVHFIYRITEKGCKIVYDNCLNLSAAPKNDISQFRGTLLVDETCKNWGGKRLVWTDGVGIYSLDVEASIATDSFTTPIFKLCNSDPCEYINLCTPTPFKCPIARFVPTPTNQLGLTNKLIDTGIQFAYRNINYDQTTSRISNISTYNYQSSTTGCFEDSTPARCMEIRLPIGNAKVEYIELLYRTDNSNNWFSAKKIPRYQQYNSAQQQWYERQLSDEVSRNFNEDDCTFEYLFCNDDFCLAVEAAEVSSNYDRSPRNPQGLFKYGNNGLAVYNYIKGNCPISKIEQDKFKVKLLCSNTNNCTTDFVEVKVRVIIHNFHHNRNQFIWRNGGTGAALEDDVNDVAFYGGLNPALNGGLEDGYGQRFYDKKRNFTIYVDGTEYFAEMKQYLSEEPFFQGGKTEWGVVGEMSKTTTRNRWRRNTRNGKFFYQEYVIKVPKGTKGFLRLQSHKETSYKPNTSTTVIATQLLSKYKGNFSTYTLSEGYKDNTKEIYFNTCGIVGSVLELDEALVVQDQAVDTGVLTGFNEAPVSAFSGYIKDCNQLPIDNSRVNIDGGSHYTDHNGFYFGYFYSTNGNDINIEAFGEKSATGVQQILKVVTASHYKGTTTEIDILADDAIYCNDFYGKVKLKVVDCNGNGLKGVRVSVSGSKGGFTNALGETNITIRNKETRDRVLKVVVMDKNSCFVIDCNNNCNPCMQDFDFTTTASYINKPTFLVGTATINSNAILKNRNGLKKGGKYQFAFQVQGSCGNFSFAYANNKGFIDIPKNNGSNFSFCEFEYDLTGINFPLSANSVNLLRTKNLNPFELQWIVDKVIKKDGKIILTIQSLNDYNFNAAFQTNTVYQYLKDDRIEISQDEKGIYLGQSLNYKTLNPYHDKVISGDEDAPADYFNQIIIEDDGRVDIKKGFIIEMQRPSLCAKEEEFYTICSSIPVVDGKVTIPIGRFSTFDTYYIKRDFGDNNKRLVEHHSPSDYWGTRISDIGIVHITNKFEDEKRYGRNITVAPNGDISNFNSFEKTFDNNEQGDIVAMGITDDDTILGICEHDNFLVQKAKDLLQITQSGNIRAISGDQTFSDPESKLIGKFGCHYDDIGSIFFGDGYVTWVDSKNNAYVMHDYSKAQDVSFQKTKKWFYNKIQEIKKWNNNTTNPLDKYRYSTGINHINGAVFLTVKRLLDKYIDNELKPNISKNETIGFNPIKGEFLGNFSFTPEGYSYLDTKDGKGCKFITFAFASPYSHPIKITKFNEFYGVAVDTVVGIALNKFPEKIKRGLAMEIQSNKNWFIHEIKTDDPNFLSEIPIANFKRTEYKSNAHFLNNKLQVGGIYGNVKNRESNGTSGYYISCIFVRDNTLNLAYGTIDNLKRVQYDELDLIMFKFATSEQSGFTENI